jgi:hypothetical protein
LGVVARALLPFFGAATPVPSRLVADTEPRRFLAVRVRLRLVLGAARASSLLPRRFSGFALLVSHMLRPLNRDKPAALALVRPKAGVEVRFANVEMRGNPVGGPTVALAALAGRQDAG